MPTRQDKKAIALLVLLILIGISNAISTAEVPSFSWAKQIGVSGKYKWDQSYALATDSLGNIIISGNLSGPVVFGGTTIDDSFIAKYDGNGNILWARRTSTTGYAYVYSIATDAYDNIITAGWFNGPITVDNQTFTSRGSTDILVCKYDSSGNLLWVNQSGGTKSDMGRSVATDNLGNIIVVGDFMGTATFGSSTTITSSRVDYSDVFVVKYNTAGDLIWVTGTSHIWESRPTGVTIDGSCSIIVTGKTHYGGFVKKYDSLGTVVWGRYIESEITQMTGAYSVVVDNADNSYFVVGSFGDTLTFPDRTLNESQGSGFMVHYNVNGDYIRVEQYQLSSKTDNGNWLAINNSHMGRLEDYVPTDYWGFSIKELERPYGLGEYWRKYVTRDAYYNYDVRETHISFDAAGNIIVAGYFKGNLFFDDITLINSAQDFDYDIFVAKLGDRRRLITKVIDGHGSISPGSGTYNNGTTVALTATPDADYQVKAWTGTNDDSTTNITNMVTMNNNKLVTVEFELIIGDPDLDGNSEIDFVDFAMFAKKWRAENCDTPDWCEGADTPDWCEGADLNKNGYVDFSDLSEFANHWLENNTY